MSVANALTPCDVAEMARKSYGDIATKGSTALEIRKAILEMLALALEESEISHQDNAQLQRANDFAAALLPFTREQVVGLYPDARRDPGVLEELRRAHTAFQLEVKVSN